MLHVYICFRQVNLGMVLICTDHASFEECHEYSNQVHNELHLKRFYAGANKSSLQQVVDRCTWSMTTVNDMKEVQLIIVRNNNLD